MQRRENKTRTRISIRRNEFVRFSLCTPIRLRVENLKRRIITEFRRHLSIIRLTYCRKHVCVNNNTVVLVTEDS